MQVRGGRALTGAMIVAALAATGCGSGDGSSTSDTTTAPTASVAKPSGTPIKIGHISDITAPGGVKFPHIAAGVQARVDAVNAAGGIKGHPLELVTCDSKGDPNAARACVRKAVDEGVVAFVGAASQTEPAYVPVLEGAKVPAIGAVPFSPVIGDSKVAFCFNGGVQAAMSGLAAALQADGAKKISFVYPSNVGPASAAAKAAFEHGVAASGVESGGAVGFAFGDTQFDAPVAKATADGVDGVAVFSPGEPEAALIRTVRQQAPDVKVATVTSLLTPEVLSALGPAAEGVSAVAVDQPATATQVPGIAQFNHDMDAFDPDGKYARTDLVINGWASVWALERVARDLPEIDRASLMRAMDEVDGLDLGGIFPPLSATDRASNPPGIGCAMSTGDVFTKVKDGKPVAEQPGEFFDPFAR